MSFERAETGAKTRQSGQLKISGDSVLGVVTSTKKDVKRTSSSVLGREKLLLISNRTREAAFHSLRELKRLVFLRDQARVGGLEEEIFLKKKQTRELFKKWKALSLSLKEV